MFNGDILVFVCSGCLTRKMMFILDIIAIIFFLLIFEQEFILFYSAEHVKIAELSQLDKNFNFILPFRGPKLAFDSPVCLPECAHKICPIYVTIYQTLFQTLFQTPFQTPFQIPSQTLTKSNFILWNDFQWSNFIHWNPIARHFS